MTDLKQTVLKKVHAGEVFMKPRWPFVLRGIATLILGIILACFVIFAMFIILVALRGSGISILPAFGAPGLFHFIKNLPWLIILGIFIALIIIEILFRKFSFGYRTPALIALGIIGIGTVLGGIFLSSIGPQSMFEGIRKNTFVRTEMMREGPQFMKTRPFFRGIIQELSVSDMLIAMENDEVIRVVFDKRTRFPEGKDVLEIGNSVFIGGIRDGNIVHAFGISSEPPEMKFRENQNNKNPQ